MKSREVPCSLREKISIQQVGAETLVYDERRHKAFCLNASSSVIWRLADGKHTIPQICAAATLELSIPVCDEFVLFALDELRKDGLIEACSEGTVEQAVSRRVMLQRIGVGGLMLLPAISAIVAPTAAQAYTGGCVDCTPSVAQQAARARRQQQSNAQPGTAPSTPSK